PEFWAHPYGPVLKNLPILALLVLLAVLEERRWNI
ncbi:MAG TPA: DoxX-like family protein, partial [Casimicrobiaceae bacterium]|nr:DoxX-like family protein [Casimicrobiaceae bacterium]